MKMHNGNITKWWKHYPATHWERLEGSLGYIICGTFEGHPYFDGEEGHTSFVMRHDEELGFVETANSYYKLIGPPIKEPVHA